MFEGPASYPEAIDIAMDAGAVPNVMPTIETEGNGTPNVEAGPDIAGATDHVVEEPAAAEELAQEITQDVHTQVSETTEAVAEDVIPQEPPQPYAEPVAEPDLQQEIQQSVNEQVANITD